MAHHFDEALPQISSNKIKTIARVWGGTTTMRKDECVACISKGLANPDQVKTVIATLDLWEQNALALIKRMGGAIESRSLIMGIKLSGIFPTETIGHRDIYIDPLFRKGLILANNRYDPLSHSFSYEANMLYSDERLLAQIGSPEMRPWKIDPMTNPSHSLSRQTSEVTLDIMGILHTIEKMEGLRLTQTGSVHANDEKKMRKAMHWYEQDTEVDGIIFPDPFEDWINALRYSGLLQLKEDNRLVVHESPENFARHSFEDQVRYLIEGMIRSDTWQQMATRSYYEAYEIGPRQGRFAVILALSGLPIDSNAFFSMNDFDQGIFNRIGDYFTLSSNPQPFYYPSSISDREMKQALAAWRDKLRANWLKRERLWLEKAFITWLYFLGLVELAVEGGKVSGFRLTNAGRLILHPELGHLSLQEESAASSTDQPVWVVQPNFDIIVYLDRTNPGQIAFLERHSQRSETHPHTAHYRLTRESVYNALESGSTLSDLLEGLQAGAQMELPQNVTVELREWASLREQIVLHRVVCLLEFPSKKNLQEALDQGLIGKIIDERFLLFEEKTASPDRLADLECIHFNYARPLPQNLSLTELGTMRLKPGVHDLMIIEQLNQWAIHHSAMEWQLTVESVSAQLRIGRKINELFRFLQERSLHTIPPLLEMALRSWSGETFNLEMESVVVLRCPEEKLFRVITASKTMRPYLKGFLPPNILIVDANQLESFQLQLEWLGCSVSDQLNILPLSTPKTRRE